MRINLLFYLCILTSLYASAQCPKLIWADEFNGTTLNTANWTAQVGDGCDINLCGWGNNELQYYQSENATVSNGTLKITAKPEVRGGKPYTSARIRTINKADFTYGRIESRMKMPVGRGIWPALWMMPTDNFYGGWPKSGELDIMEYLGHEPNTIHGTLHFGEAWPNNSSTTKKYTTATGTFHNEWHTYELEWDESEIRWYVDGYLYSTKTKADLNGKQWPFDKRFHFILNMAVGGNWPGNPNSTTSFPQTFEVDYVRIYEMKRQPYLVGSTSAETGKEVTYEIAAPSSNTKYTWSVPSDAKIIAGDNTSKITVRWGAVSGKVSVNTENECGNKLYSVAVNAGASFEKKNSLENFDEPALAIKTSSTGVLTAGFRNSFVNTINRSALCGKYDRKGTELFDVLFYSTKEITDAKIFIDNKSKVYIDIHTNAPIGTNILLQYEDSRNAKSTNYPVGRRARFQAKVEKQNEWHRLLFEFLDEPHPSTSNTSIDQLVLLFAPNTTTSHTYYFDNFDIYAPSTFTNLLLVDQINVIKYYPNPTSDFLNFTSSVPIKLIQVFDFAGRNVLSVSLNSDIESIDVSTLRSGMYLLNIVTEDQKQNIGRFVKN